MTSHNDTVVRQFSLQSDAFSRCPAHADSKSVDVFADLGTFTSADRLLDSGCGPGIVSAALARRVGHVHGIDLTPAMIALAEQRAASAGLTNVAFGVGDMSALPFDDDTFDGAVTRYTVHHLDTPLAAVREMVRVTRPGGRVVSLDAVPQASRRDTYDRFERRRDPSHTTALTLEEWMAMGEALGLGPAIVERFSLRMDVRDLLAHAFPDGDDRSSLERALRDDVGLNTIGMSATVEDGLLVIYFPLAAVAWTKPEGWRAA
ncbi:MAG: class I SAM-dependent methyltransferase [Vicinamibacterales bacterium]